MDVKIGRKSYDPFASSEKIQQQVSKYPLMEDIGFLVLGMRVRVIFSVILFFVVSNFTLTTRYPQLSIISTLAHSLHSL